MKQRALALLGLFSLAACNTLSNQGADVIDENPVVGENQVIEEQIEENRYSQTVDFLEKAENLSVTEIVEANRSYYIENAPEYWSSYEDVKDYPEHIKLYLYAWKTGTFKMTDYAGQSLVLVQQGCEGPCSGSFFRYAVDEVTDTWTLLTAYSSEEGESVGGPADARDATVKIPELEVPKTLEAYENDEVALLSEYSRLNADRFPDSPVISDTKNLTKLTDFPDPSFPQYFQDSGCLYGISPDGMMARYTVIPDIFTSTEISATEFTFVDKNGSSQKKTFSLSAGACGLAWTCLSTFKLSANDNERLQEVGTLDGRPVYLPTTVAPREDLPDTYSLDQSLHSAYANYLTTNEYDLDKDPAAPTLTMEEFLKTNSALILKLDNGSGMLTYEAKYAPSDECGKPVIYLYPEENNSRLR